MEVNVCYGDYPTSTLKLSDFNGATNGGDYDDIAAELAREQEIAKNLDITLDKDLQFEPVQQELELDVGQVEEKPKPTRKRRRSK